METEKQEEERIILPFKVPEIKTYPKFTAINAILEAHGVLNEWIGNNYILPWAYTRIDDGHYWTDFVFKDDYVDEVFCPLIERTLVPRKIIRDQYSSICDYLKEVVKGGDYSSLSIDKYYIKEYFQGEPVHIKHQILVVGFDEMKQVFFCADFFHYNYKMIEVDSKQLQQAYQNVWRDEYKYEYDSCVDIERWRYCPGRYEIDPESIKGQIKDFMTGKNTTILSFLSAFQDHNPCFGFDCLQTIKAVATQCIQGKQEVDIRAISNLVVFHLCMLQRIPLLKEHHMFKEKWEDERMKILAQKALELSRFLLISSMKYNMKQYESYLGIFQHKYDEMLTSEIELFDQLSTALGLVVKNGLIGEEIYMSIRHQRLKEFRGYYTWIMNQGANTRYTILENLLQYAKAWNKVDIQILLKAWSKECHAQESPLILEEDITMLSKLKARVQEENLNIDMLREKIDQVREKTGYQKRSEYLIYDIFPYEIETQGLFEENVKRITFQPIEYSLTDTDEILAMSYVSYNTDQHFVLYESKQTMVTRYHIVKHEDQLQIADIKVGCKVGSEILKSYFVDLISERMQIDRYEYEDHRLVGLVRSETPSFDVRYEEWMTANRKKQIKYCYKKECRELESVYQIDQDGSLDAIYINSMLDFEVLRDDIKAQWIQAMDHEIAQVPDRRIQQVISEYNDSKGVLTLKVAFTGESTQYRISHMEFDKKVTMFKRQNRKILILAGELLCQVFGRIYWNRINSTTEFSMYHNERDISENQYIQALYKKSKKL